MTVVFEDFLKKRATRIDNVADKFRSFEIGAMRLGIKIVRERIVTWLANFDKLQFEDFDLPLILLEHTEFATTADIYHKIIKDAKEIVEDDKTFIAPLGEINESSYKISANLHRNPRYRGSIGEVLELMTTDMAFNLVFLDDFLNSGGQVISIFLALFNEQPLAGEPNDEIETRTKLSTREIEILKKTKLHFYYYLAYTEGVKQVEKILKNKLQLDAKVSAHYTTNNNHGVFGDEEEQENIRLGASGRIKSGSTFNGYEYKSLTKFYRLLSDVGKQLLQINEPGWTSEKYEKRALGYGNLCRAIITESNIPTVTFTAMWQSAFIPQDDGGAIRWNELFPRVKKIIRPKGSFVENAKGTKKEKLEATNLYLQQLYITDFISLGLAEAEKAYLYFELDFKLLRHVIRFNLRSKRWTRTREIISGIDYHLETDGIAALCCFSLFESELREAYDVEKEGLLARIKEARSILDDVPITYKAGPDYFYWNGRWHLEVWFNETKKDNTHLNKALINFQSANAKKHKWFYQCNSCLVLHLLKDSTAMSETSKFFEEMRAQRLISPDRPAIRTYSITSYLLMDDRKGLINYLKEITKPSSATDFQGTVFQHIDLIYNRDKRKRESYKVLLTKWLSRLPLR
jgi:hypothetical protein